MIEEISSVNPTFAPPLSHSPLWLTFFSLEEIDLLLLLSSDDDFFDGLREGGRVGILRAVSASSSVRGPLKCRNGRCRVQLHLRVKSYSTYEKHSFIVVH